LSYTANLPEDVRRKVSEEVKRGRVVIIHPQASQKFSGQRVTPIDYPK